MLGDPKVASAKFLLALGISAGLQVSSHPSIEMPALYQSLLGAPFVRLSRCRASLSLQEASA